MSWTIEEKIAQAELEHWEELELVGMELTEIPDTVFQLVNLQSLDLSCNRISIIPDSITRLTNLKYLHFNNNRITRISDSIDKLFKLEKLHLCENQLHHIPESIGRLARLTSLQLSNNKITNIPLSIYHLKKLTILWLDNNQIGSISSSISELIRLIDLRLNNNKISIIPSSISDLINLRTLEFDQNQINSIPASIGQLYNLRILRLNDNRISSIPNSIANLSELLEFNANSNRIVIFTSSITKLSKLKSLDLKNNFIEEIPPSIGDLSRLTDLDLGCNRIKRLPDSITQLSSLRRLVLKENQIVDIPPEILRKGWGKEDSKDGEPRVILSFIRSIAENPLNKLRPLNELKVLLIGEGDVGKTSILKSLLKKPFDEQELKTPGITIKQHLVSIDNVSIRLNYWDFGGQRIMHNTHQFFLTKRSLYLLVLDNRKNEQQNRIEHWLKLIETYGGDSPVIIIGNCADEHPLDIKQNFLQKKYPQVKAFIATSCKTGIGIPELKKAIYNQVKQMPHVQNHLPLAWFAIKSKLEKMQQEKVDFISYEKYQEICARRDVANVQSQRDLIGFLHDLGIILNFQDDLRLQDTNVLNPEWVTSGVYDILNSHELMVIKKGILNLPDLKNILRKIDRYPENKRPFLMSLMEKFELCFKIDGYSPERYLISDLLPIDEPDIDVYENASIHFQYRYDILPSRIISSFIVRNHAMIYKNTLWRSGAVLTQDFAKALIRADEEDNIITIKIKGKHSNTLLSTIRADFKKIHVTIPNLAVREYLVIHELDKNQATGRDVPVDYNYLCELDLQGLVESPLPQLKGKYNIRNILEGIESSQQRQSDRANRQAFSWRSRDTRRMGIRKKKQRSGLFTSSSLMLGVLAIVSGIFAALARYIPVPQLLVIIPAILLTFALLIIPILLITGKISEDAFNQGLAGFFAALPALKGKDPDKKEEESANLPAENSKKE
jgi:internalin A